MTPECQLAYINPAYNNPTIPECERSCEPAYNNHAMQTHMQVLLWALLETCSPVMDPAMKDLEIQGHSTRALL